MYDIIAVLIPIVFAVCIVVAIRIVVEARLRRRLAETHASEELLHSMLVADAENRRQSSLKWGLVMVLLGFALAAVDLLGLSVDDPSAFGLLFGAIGVGLIAYYASTRRALAAR